MLKEISRNDFERIKHLVTNFLGVAKENKIDKFVISRYSSGESLTESIRLTFVILKRLFRSRYFIIEQIELSDEEIVQKITDHIKSDGGGRKLLANSFLFFGKIWKKKIKPKGPDSLEPIL